MQEIFFKSEYVTTQGPFLVKLRDHVQQVPNCVNWRRRSVIENTLMQSELQRALRRVRVN